MYFVGSAGGVGAVSPNTLLHRPLHSSQPLQLSRQRNDSIASRNLTQSIPDIRPSHSSPSNRSARIRNHFLKNFQSFFFFFFIFLNLISQVLLFLNFWGVFHSRIGVLDCGGGVQQWRSETVCAVRPAGFFPTQNHGKVSLAIQTRTLTHAAVLFSLFFFFSPFSLLFPPPLVLFFLLLSQRN